LTKSYKIVFILLFVLTSLESYSQSWNSIITSFCTDENEGVSIRLHNGKQYFTGVYEGDLNIGFNSISGWAYDDIFIGKASLEGNTEWLVAIKGNQIDRSNNIEVINNQVVVSGTFSDSLFIGNDTLVNNHQRAAFLAFYDTLGNHISTFLPDVYNAEFRDFKEDSDGNIILCGDLYNHFVYGGFSINSSSGLNFFLAKYDPVQDSIIWGINATQGTSEGKYLSIDPDDNLYVAGIYNEGSYIIDTLLLTGNGNHNMFISKFDTDGNKSWLNTIEGVAEVHGYGVAADDNGNAFLIGEFEGDINVGGNLMTSGGFYDAVLVKYDTNGNVLWSEGFGGADSDEGYDIVLDDNMDPIVMFEAGAGISYKGQSISINGWNEPVLMKVRNDNGDLIWYRNLASTITSGLVNGISISIEGNNIGLTGINRSSIVFNGNTFNANNDKDFYSVIIEDSLTYHLGITESIDENVISIYPNPVKGQLNIRSVKSIDKIEIYSTSGQRIYKRVVYTNDYTIFLPYVKPGMYIVQATTGDSVSQSKILVL